MITWVFRNGINRGFVTKTENMFVINAISMRTIREEKNCTTLGINLGLTSESNTDGGENVGNK